MDDDPDLRELMRSILARQDRQMAWAATASQAVLTALEVQPELVLLDIGLEEGDGFTVLRSMQQNPTLRTIPVIMITGRTDEAAVVMSLDLGAVDHITKPFRPAEIEARIRRYLKR